MPPEKQPVDHTFATVADPVGLLVGLFTHAPIGLAIWASDRKPFVTNRAFRAIAGADPTVLTGELPALLEKAFAGETVRVPTFWFATPERRIAISLTIFPVSRPDGSIDFVAATLEDQTDEETEVLRRAKDAAEAANVELEAFSYSVAHDLRAPLRAMAGFSNILREDYGDRLDDEGRHLLGRIAGGASRMGALIDGLLTLANVVKRDLQYETVDLAKFAHDAISQIDCAERIVEWVISDGLVVRGDAVLLRSVMQNLIANALRFTAKRDRARVEVGRSDLAGVRTFFVKDNGAGFDNEHAGQLFRPFRRLHRPDEFEGNGIGLATTERIIRRHGGRIWADGVVGVGATFYFTL
jgi:signal transduction histidine kinase